MNVRHCRLTGVLPVLCLAVLSFRAAAIGAEVEQWGVWETSLDGPRDGNPYLDVQLAAAFSQGDRRIVVPGFYDGDGVYKVRFSPPVQGQWRYETRSNRPELSGKIGSFTAGSPTADNCGPIGVFKTFYLRYADGTPYHQFGTTCYAWIHQTERLQQQTLKTLAASPFNKIRFCIFPKSYAYNQNEPALFAFQKKDDETFDFECPDPAFWRHLEQRILDLQRLGIEADLILWHPYDRWGFADMSDSQDDRYLRYCIARLSAYRNVWWSLANGFDFMTDRPKGHRGNKQMEDWDRFFQILQNEYPYQRMQSIHNSRVWYDHNKAWVTHASLQTSEMAGGARFREKYQVAYRFTQYAPGEKLRPQVKISASEVEGVPPLTVKFRSETAGAIAWDFGDGATSTANPATHTAENVCWYFSRVQDQPGEASLVLDRKTTYNAGPVAAEPGPLAVGNFNETMRSDVPNRQFRGEIRALQIFGSRISGRGALDLVVIKRYVP